MTTMTVPTTNAAHQLRRVLRVDGVVTAGVGLLGLLGPSWYGEPAWLARTVGAALLLIGVEVFLLASHRRLKLVATVVAEAAFAWVVALVVAGLVDMDTAGREVLALTAVVTLAFGITETRLVRSMR